MALDRIRNWHSKTNRPQPSDHIVKAQTFRVLHWWMAVVAAIWLATTVTVIAVQATAPQPFDQSPLATPVQRRSQQIVPSPAPRVTIEPYQVSPLRIDNAERPLLGDASALWIGAAGLLLLSGSAVLVLTRRR